MLKDLALNVSTDRENLVNLSKANVTLQTLATTLHTTLTKVEDQLKTITNRLIALEKKSGTKNEKFTGRKKFYCWTCGVNWDHRRKRCTISAPNHDKTAWWRDRTPNALR